MINEIIELVGKEYFLTTDQHSRQNSALIRGNDETDIFFNNTVTEIDTRLANNTVTSLQHSN